MAGYSNMYIFFHGEPFHAAWEAGQIPGIPKCITIFSQNRATYETDADTRL